MFCVIHPESEMEEKTGQYGTYFSHQIKDVGYCNGKKITPFKTPTPSTGTTSSIPVSPPQVIEPPIKQEVDPKVWEDKDRRIAIENSLSHAVKISNEIADSMSDLASDRVKRTLAISRILVKEIYGEEITNGEIMDLDKLTRKE